MTASEETKDPQNPTPRDHYLELCKEKDRYRQQQMQYVWYGLAIFGAALAGPLFDNINPEYYISVASAFGLVIFKITDACILVAKKALRLMATSETNCVL